jgi:four helix bundle protein
MAEVLRSAQAMSNPSPERLRTLKLQERVFTFASSVVRNCPTSALDIASREIRRQLVRAATSTSNNLEEADEASSTADFIAKMKLALREAKASRRCLRFVVECKLARHQQVSGLLDEARQIGAIFAKIVINTKQRANFPTS